MSLPEGVWDAEAVEVLGRKAWELGVPKEAFAGIVSEFAARSAEAQKAAEAAEVERVEGVKSELEVLWGEGYDGHMQGAVKAINPLCKMAGMGEEDAEVIRNDPAVGTNLRVLRLLAQMKSRALFGLWNDFKVKVSIRDDMEETLQIRAKFGCGATRLEEKGVVKVLCKQ